MKVTLIDWTGKGAKNAFAGEDIYGEAAIDLLLFTKNTRLTMTPGLLEEISRKPYHKKLEDLAYMANTIPSSWEFVHYSWMIEGVSRGFTHQFVRSRQFSFAQQTMRVLDVSTGTGWDYLTGPTLGDQTKHVKMGDESYVSAKAMYHAEMENIDTTYKALIAVGVAIEDARGILPTNILTNIVGSCNMRTFVELVRKRSSPRTQNEYRDVLEAMKTAVRTVHPWIDLFINRDIDKAIADLQDKISKLPKSTSNDTNYHLMATDMTKLLDQIRAQS